jgi:hypothetical protein
MLRGGNGDDGNDRVDVRSKVRVINFWFEVPRICTILFVFIPQLHLAPRLAASLFSAPLLPRHKEWRKKD